MTELEVGEYYVYKGERGRGWDVDGYMEKVLDGLPHLCTYSNGQYASFDVMAEQHEEATCWAWGNDINNFKLAERGTTVEKVDEMKYGDIVWAYTGEQKHEDGHKCKFVAKLPDGTAEYVVYVVNSIEASNTYFVTHCEPYKDFELMRPMTNPEVFKAIGNGAVIMTKSGIVSNQWADNRRVDKHKICYNYNECDDDVWERLEVKVD